jgi:toxin ParE1/3/4
VLRGVALRPATEADLDSIWRHTAQAWSEAQAEAYLMGLDSVLRLLAEFPEIARLREEFRPPIRIHPYRAHLILYEADDVILDVVRIVNGRTDWRVLLSE